MIEIPPPYRLAVSLRGVAGRLAVAVFIATAAWSPIPCVAQSSGFMQPSVTSNYLESLRRRATTYREDPFGTGETDTEEESQRYGSQGRGAAIGASLFDFSRTEAARPRQSTYDEITRSSLFPPTSPRQSTLNEANYEAYYTSLREIGDESRKRVEQLATQTQEFSPYETSIANPITNPYRNDLFQAGPSNGRFGNQSIDLRNRLPTGRGSGTRDNVNLGLLTARVGLIGGVSYTDNALFARDNKTADLIAQVGLRIRTEQRITKENNLSFQIGVGYDRYLVNTELNDIISSSGINFSISPRSNLSFETSIGNVFVRIFDSFAVTQTNNEDALAQASTNFTRFDNTIGMAASIQLNQSTSFTATLSRGDRIALETEFSNSDQTSYNFLGDIEYSPGQKWIAGREGVWFPSPEESWVAGLTVAAARNLRSSTTLNDSTTFTLGPYFGTPISKFTRVRIAGGLQQGNFDEEASVAGGTTTPPVDLNDFFASLNIVNQLNNFTNQSIRIGHESGLGDTSNFFTADFIRHNFVFRLGPRTNLSTSLYYEEQQDSPGETQEHLVRQGGSLLLSHELNSRVSLYVGFNSGISDSTLLSGTPAPIRDPNDPTRILNTPGTDIKQETFTFDIAFPFARDIDLVLGYRRLATTSTSRGANFVENRGSINFSYNF